jgi:hypothetical protein
MYSTNKAEFVAYFSIIISLKRNKITNMIMLKMKEAKSKKPKNPLLPVSAFLNWGKNFMVTPLRPNGKTVPNKVAVEYKILVSPNSSGESMVGCKIKTFTKPIIIPR